MPIGKTRVADRVIGSVWVRFASRIEVDLMSFEHLHDAWRNWTLAKVFGPIIGAMSDRQHQSCRFCRSAKPELPIVLVRVIGSVWVRFASRAEVDLMSFEHLHDAWRNWTLAKVFVPIIGAMSDRQHQSCRFCRSAKPELPIV